ncbi:2-amino-4-hydroxy-6-hydroxymethyldihydropteridine diphosphokinase [Thiocystis violacea]|uniref:2-amino-4-hydroxy-6- hydroxymethyldihydropteridine diphosphokinase n=1 Tax=Thiocystis violacea TaxID=13725 RepID=UPI0019083ADE|nr:2-amino-4-hydroxy-6-hydroxymethyldihydropteridine diphosphokinase [Thiocystis violacea]MBK1722008.1 2-amino-4-hydroxy-6-hydroxymethyldihydropteridine diphosphokinase [Thiocystis violacea]
MTDKTFGAYVALGSNIEPDENIRRGLALLREVRDTRLVAESSRYRTAPWGIETQPDFINLVVALSTGLTPLELLEATQEIERRLARRRDLKNGPRTIDLDILLYDGQMLDEDDLKIPHPGLLIRDFMLVPLIEIAPEAMHPVRGLPVRALTEEIRYRQILERLPSEDEHQGCG